MIYQIFSRALQRDPEAIAIVSSRGDAFTYAMVRTRVH
jgi:hypothetical protein